MNIKSLEQRVKRLQKTIDPHRTISVLHEVGTNRYLVDGKYISYEDIKALQAKGHFTVIRAFPAGYLSRI